MSLRQVMKRSRELARKEQEKASGTVVESDDDEEEPDLARKAPKRQRRTPSAKPKAKATKAKKSQQAKPGRFRPKGYVGGNESDDGSDDDDGSDGGSGSELDLSESDGEEIVIPQALDKEALIKDEEDRAYLDGLDEMAREEEFLERYERYKEEMETRRLMQQIRRKRREERAAKRASKPKRSKKKATKAKRAPVATIDDDDDDDDADGDGDDDDRGIAQTRGTRSNAATGKDVMLPSERRKLAKKQQARELLKKKMAAARAKAAQLEVDDDDDDDEEEDTRRRRSKKRGDDDFQPSGSGSEDEDEDDYDDDRGRHDDDRRSSRRRDSRDRDRDRDRDRGSSRRSHSRSHSRSRSPRRDHRDRDRRDRRSYSRSRSRSRSYSHDRRDRRSYSRSRSHSRSRSRSPRDEDMGRASPPSPPMDVTDMNSCRLTRYHLSKWCHEPYFRDLVRGTWVRVGAGMNPATRQPQYKAYQVKRVVMYSRTYKLEGTQTKYALEVDLHGKGTKAVRMDLVSNHRITDAEYQAWVANETAAGAPLPTQQSCKQLHTDIITKTKTHQYSAAEVSRMVAWRSSVPRNVQNIPEQRERLLLQLNQLKQKSGAKSRADDIRRVSAQIKALDDELARRMHTVPEVQKAKVEVNRRKKARTRNHKIKVGAREEAFERKIDEKLLESNAFVRRPNRPGVLWAGDLDASVLDREKDDMPSKPDTPKPDTPKPQAPSASSKPAAAAAPVQRLDLDLDDVGANDGDNKPGTPAFLPEQALDFDIAVGVGNSKPSASAASHSRRGSAAASAEEDDSAVVRPGEISLDEFLLQA